MNHSTGDRATLTRLGRAIRAAGGGTATVKPQHREEHRQTCSTPPEHEIPLVPDRAPFDPRAQITQWVAIRGRCEPAQPPSGA